MKKVFAFLSVFALTIAFVGFGAKSANADDKLFTVDPTLSENQIPMYIMDSIYTTFPNYYDYATGGDEQWGGAARMYPWNETRLQVKLIDEDGNWVKAANGETSEYAVYFSGATTASSAGAGNNILFYDVDADGNPVMRRLSGGVKYDADGNIKWDSSAMAMDPSLSHMRKNISDQDLVFDPVDLFATFGATDAKHNLTNRALTFDANGRMIRGITLDGGYLLPDAEGAQPVTIAPEYCYVDGVVTKIEDGVVCDVEEVTNEETGETKSVTQYITNRFVWQYYSAEDFDPSMVNEVPYLSEGWDAQKWDYVNEEEDGYVCIAFVSSEGGAFKLTPEQLAVYTETCAANGLPAPVEGDCRLGVREVVVPAGGWTYDFGYLDKGKSRLCEKFMDMFIDGYYYGRKVDEEGKGMGYQSTHDFSASPIYAKDIENNGVSYQVMDGQNVIEVLQGETVYPTKNIVYSGMAKYWAEPGNFLSYKSDTSVLELYVKQDGVTVVQPNTGYNSHAEMAEDFMADFNAFYAKKQGYQLQEDGSYAKEDGSVYTPLATPSLPEGATADDAKAAIGGTTGAWYAAIPYNLVGLSSSENTFVGDAEMWAKWGWMFEYMNIKLDTVASGLNLTTKLVASPGNWAYTMWCFLAEAPLISGWPSSKVDWTDAGNWCDTRTNLEKWNQYTIDTATAAVDTNYVLEFKVVNPQTELATELKLTYVVVDEYTPILKVNKNNLIYAPQVSGDKVTMPTIDKYTFCTAYNARYNGKDIKGDDISYKVHYYSETLDFDNPTEGNHVVTAKVYNQTKWVEKSFVVSIEDVTAPRVNSVGSITIGLGEHFDLLCGVLYAYDNVDGNLLDMERSYWFDLISKPVDIQTVGTYEVVLEIWDAAGNSTELSYDVKVVSNKVNEELADGIAANKQAIDNLEGLIIELSEKVAEIQEAQEAAAAKKCGSKSAIMVQFLAAASLLVVFLRKKH